jgi:peptide deformylase
LASLIQNLRDTLLANSGLGLSANQIGDDRAVFVLDLSEQQEPPIAFVNPQVIRQSNPGLVSESCLSVPDTTGTTIRHTHAEIVAVNEFGMKFQRKLSGMAAVSFLHEMDHLAGKLFVDHLIFPARLLYRVRGWRRTVMAQ